MCDEVSPHPQLRRRSSSISLTVFQWTGRNKRDSGIGSTGSLNSPGANMTPSESNVDESDSLSNEQSRAISTPIDIRRVSESESVNFRRRNFAFQGRSTSGPNLGNLSRSVGTQTPTEEGIFAFPEPAQGFQPLNPVPGQRVLEDVADECIPLAEFNSDLENARIFRRRRNRNFPQVQASPATLSPNVPRSNAIPIPGASSIMRRHSVSYVRSDTECIGQQLRVIGDGLDREFNIAGTSANRDRSIGRRRSFSVLPRRSQ